MNRSNALGIVLIISVFVQFCWVNIIYTENSNLGETDLNIERVALFKNGMGFFSSTGTLPDRAKTVRIGQIPIPVFGTFWVGYSEEVKVRSLITSLEELEEEIPFQNMGQMLRANTGRTVTLRLGRDEKDIIKGTIMPSPANLELPQMGTPYFMKPRLESDPNNRSGLRNSGSNLLIVKTSEGIICMNLNHIERADFESEDIVSAATSIIKRPSIRIELDRAAGGEEISVSYLARGMTWVPGYLIDLSDPKTAKFSAQALIVNELTDLNNVQLDLVTGFPNIKFSEVNSPIGMSQNLAAFMNSLTKEASTGRRSENQYMLSQRAVTMNVPAYESFESSPQPGYSTAAQGQVSEDLFLYPVEDFSSGKGETAWIPLFTAEMEYEHIYTWKIGDFLDKDNYYRTETDGADGKKAEEVWHTCRLVNNLEMPLTTASAEFIKDGAFTGQDICYYTAPGAKTTIRINRAMNVLAEQAEVEVQRTRSAAKFYSYNYDLVKVKGELKLHSRLDKPIKVEVSKELSGEVSQTIPRAEDLKTAKGLKKVNPKHVLTWKIDLQPGEELLLTYMYEVYVRA